MTLQQRDEHQGAEFKGALETAQRGVIALENREFNSSYNSFKILNFTAWAVGICAFCLGGLGVANTMLLSVFTRIREIAVLRDVNLTIRGDGPLAAKLSRLPPNWNRDAWRRVPPGDDRETALARVIKFGLPGPPMAGHEYLSDAELTGLARYVRALHKPDDRVSVAAVPP